MTTSTMGIAGHGMLIAPVCPCRAVLIDDLLVIGRGYKGNLITEVVIKRGSAPATIPATSPDRISYAFGPGGPEMRVESSNLDDVVMKLDVGIGPGEWTIMAPGFFFDMPRSVIVYSPDPSTPGDLPELHHGMNLEAMIMFSRAGASAHEIVPTAPGGKPLASSTVATPYGAVRAYAYDYDHGGLWKQHIYVLPYAEGRSIVMKAQAPLALWPDIQAAAELVARSFEPMR